MHIMPFSTTLNLLMSGSFTDWLAFVTAGLPSGRELLRVIAHDAGDIGTVLLVLGSIWGVLLSSKTAQKIKAIGGKAMHYHRLMSLVGTVLLLLHPLPLLWANAAARLDLFDIFIPFSAFDHTLPIAMGSLSAYLITVVTVSSIYMRFIDRRLWRYIHYGSYAALTIGLMHGFFSGGFIIGETTLLDKPGKILMLILGLLLTGFPLWRLVAEVLNLRSTVAALKGGTTPAAHNQASTPVSLRFTQGRAIASQPELSPGHFSQLHTSHELPHS